MKLHGKLAAILVGSVMLVLGHGPSVFAKADKNKAEVQKTRSPKGFYIMEGREDMMKRMGARVPAVRKSIQSVLLTGSTCSRAPVET